MLTLIRAVIVYFVYFVCTCHIDRVKSIYLSRSRPWNNNVSEIDRTGLICAVFILTYTRVLVKFRSYYINLTCLIFRQGKAIPSLSEKVRERWQIGDSGSSGQAGVETRRQLYVGANQNETRRYTRGRKSLVLLLLCFNVKYEGRMKIVGKTDGEDRFTETE